MIYTPIPSANRSTCNNPQKPVTLPSLPWDAPKAVVPPPAPKVTHVTSAVRYTPDVGRPKGPPPVVKYVTDPIVGETHEERMARDMAERCRQEGHMRGLPTGSVNRSDGQPKNGTNEDRCRYAETRKRAILATIGWDEVTVKEVVLRRQGSSEHGTADVMRRMEEAGLLSKQMKQCTSFGLRMRYTVTDKGRAFLEASQ